MTDDRKDILQKRMSDVRRAAEERDAERRAAKNGCPYIDVRKVPVVTGALKLIHEAEARDARAAAIELRVHEVAVAAVDPMSLKVRKIADDLVGKRYVPKLFTVSQSGLEEAWRLYKFVSSDQEGITGKLEINKVEELTRSIKNLKGVETEFANHDLKKLSTTELFQIILAGALALRSSDIHFEAEENSARIRYRLDGLLHEAFAALPQRNYDSLVSRIKLLSGLKINIHGEPQDGRFTIQLLKKEIEVRVSVIPSEFGETVVMRILDPDSINVDLNRLGIRNDDMAIVLRAIEKPNGLILNTGPTGSGKTTTLYAFLRTIVKPEIKIITVEDPIEYRLQGIEQTQANPDVGYTFAGGLRAILRQDPDVILIGEIRDQETANIALQAALTGHIVFSTLHTNDAVGAVPRLVDLGVKPSTIGPALSLVIAQRLVRRLCENCRAVEPVSDDLTKKVSTFLGGLPARVKREDYATITVYKAVGCEQCSGLGYRGRLGIYEFLEVGGKSDVEALIFKNPTPIELWDAARANGMVSMQEDGVLKVISGLTSFDEVESVAGKIPWLRG